MSALRRQRGGGDGEADRVSVAALALGDEVQVSALACMAGAGTCADGRNAWPLIIEAVVWSSERTVCMV